MALLIGGPEVFGIAVCLQDVEFDGLGCWVDVFVDLVAFLLRFLSILPFLTDHISQMEIEYRTRIPDRQTVMHHCMHGERRMKVEGAGDRLIRKC